MILVMMIRNKLRVSAYGLGRDDSARDAGFSSNSGNYDYGVLEYVIPVITKRVRPNRVFLGKVDKFQE